MTEQEIKHAVQGLVAETLCLPRERVAPGDRLMLDLGAESIDLLDLRFRLERAFGLSISNQDLARATGPEMTPELFRTVFTVEALCAYVCTRLEPDRA